MKASEIMPIMEYLELNTVPIMGRVGAGAVIEPDNEQVPPDGLGEVELPFPISEEIVAFEIVGRFDAAKYETGDMIVVYREQRHPLSSFYGEEAVVRLKTGERYLKTIERGKSPSVVNLDEFQRQADRRREAGVDRRDLPVPCPRARSTDCAPSRPAPARRRSKGQVGERFPIFGRS